MAVESPQISVDPYKSQVPLAPIVPPTQIPRDDLQFQQAPMIYSKTGGIMQVADNAMKGLLKGLQLKEERKFKTAEATMAAQDAGIGAAKKNYEDLMVTKGAFEADGKTPKAETQAAYAAWQTAVNAAAAQRQAFAIPEKTPKGKKGDKKATTAADGAPAAGGFGGALKQFFERNPTVLPELAITGWKAAQNTPYGQKSPELEAAKMQRDAAQRDEVVQKATFDATETRKKYAGKSEADLEKMPPSDPKGPFKNALEEYRNAVEYLTPIKAATKWVTLVDPQGQEHTAEAGSQIPDGWKLYEKPSASSTPKVGSPEEITANYLSQHKIKPEDAPPELLKYLRDYATYKAAQGSTSTSSSTVDVHGNRVSTTSTSRGAAAPRPPAGFSPVGEEGIPQQGFTGQTATPRTGRGFRPPAAPGTGRGAMTAPPGEGKPTLVDANRTERVQNEETTRYQRATDAYQKQLNTIRAKADFTTEKGKAQYKLDSSDAQNAYEKAKAQIVLWKAGQIKAIGGDPWKQKSKDSLGNPIGTMDGENWVNTKTGMGVPAPTGGTGGKTGAVTAPPAQGGQAQQGGTEADQPLNPYGDPGPGKTHYAIKCADGSIATGYLDANGLALVKGKPGVVDVRPIE